MFSWRRCCWTGYYNEWDGNGITHIASFLVRIVPSGGNTLLDHLPLCYYKYVVVSDPIAPNYPMWKRKRENIEQALFVTSLLLGPKNLDRQRTESQIMDALWYTIAYVWGIRHLASTQSIWENANLATSLARRVNNAERSEERDWIWRS